VGAPPHWMTVLLVCLATYRLTRFITKDAFPLIAGPRRWVDTQWNPFPDENVWQSYKQSPPAAKVIVIENLRKTGVRFKPNGFLRSIAYLIGCAWCTSIWVAGGVVILVALFTPTHWVTGILLWLTASAVTGLISQREPE